MIRRPTLALAAAVAFSACSHPAPAAIAATPVELATAAAPGTRAIYRGPGTVAAAHTYRIGFEIPGRVTSVRVDVGDRVAAGTVLATIDTSDYGAQYRAAAARAASAGAVLERARAGARPQERFAARDAVAAARAQLDRALAAAHLAAENRRRYDELYASGDIAGTQHDGIVASDRDAAASVQAARAQLASAEAAASLVQSGPRSEDIDAARADAAGAVASAQLAAVTLRKTALVAPAAAFIEERDVEPGNAAQPGAVAFVLTGAGESEIHVAVPEAELANLALGSEAEVTFAGRIRRGVIARIEPGADNASRTALVRVRIAGWHERPGTIVGVALGKRRDLGTAAVPIAAIVTAPDGTQSVAVYDAATRTTQRRGVRVLESDGDRALVAGIAPGTRIVSAGAHLVTPGAAVTIVGAR